MDYWSEFSISLKGSEADLKKMLGIISGYQRGSGRDEYYKITVINGEDVSSLSNEMIDGLDLTKGKISVSGNGPWGGEYILTHHDGLFKEMAEAVPEASFNAEISGSGTYDNQHFNCSMDNKLLKMKCTYSSPDVDYEEDDKGDWIDMFVEKLPLKDFVEMFKVSDLDEDAPLAYGDFVGECFYEWGVRGDDTAGWWDITYETFVESLEDYDATTDLSLEEFNSVLLNKARFLNIPDRVSENEDMGGTDSDYEAAYDPVAKKYIKEWEHPF